MDTTEVLRQRERSERTCTTVKHYSLSIQALQGRFCPHTLLVCKTHTSAGEHNRCIPLLQRPKECQQHRSRDHTAGQEQVADMLLGVIAHVVSMHP